MHSSERLYCSKLLKGDITGPRSSSKVILFKGDITGPRSSSKGSGMSRMLSSSSDDDSTKDCFGPEDDSNHYWFATFACLDLKGTMMLNSLIVLGMLILGLMVEELFAKLGNLSKSSHFWSSVLHAVEKELMVLGIISFLLFLFEQTFADVSHELEELAHLIEYCHLLLFFSIVAYYAFVVAVGIITTRHLRLMKQFDEEIRSSGDYNHEREMQLLEESLNVSCGDGRRAGERYSFYKMKMLFLRSMKNREVAAGMNLVFNEFDYSSYVNSCTTHLFVKMIHVGWRLWTVVILVLSALVGLFSVLQRTNNLTEQLEHMWLSDGRMIESNNFAVDFFNITGAILLVLSRCLYLAVVNDGVVERMEALIESEEQRGSCTVQEEMSEELSTPLTNFAHNQSRKAPGDRTTIFDPFRRCMRQRDSEDPYRSLWFLKAPDLLLRVYQSNILFFSFYAAAFLVILRFANTYAWIFFVVYPAIVLFGVAYQMLPYYAMCRYIGSLTLENAFVQAYNGEGSVSDRNSQR